MSYSASETSYTPNDPLLFNPQGRLKSYSGTDEYDMEASREDQLPTDDESEAGYHNSYDGGSHRRRRISDREKQSVLFHSSTPQDRDREGSESGRIPREGTPRGFDGESKGYRSEGQSPQRDRSRMDQEVSLQFPRQVRMPKRGGRKRLRRTAIPMKGRVGVYCVCSELKIEALLEYLQTKPNRKEARQGVTGSWSPDKNEPEVQWCDSIYLDIIHSTTEIPSNSDMEGDRDKLFSTFQCLNAKHVFYFSYGSVIFWGLTVQEEQKLLADIRPYCVGEVSVSELEQSQDDMTYCYVEAGDLSNARNIKADEIILGTTNFFEKLSYSFALAQSAKLFVFEERLNNTIEETRIYPIELKDTGRIRLEPVQMNKLIGKVLMERNEVNLHSDILDIPEFFWEEDAWQPHYQRLCTYLDMPQRVTVINRRLDILRELLDVLHNQVTNTHAIHLEFIIIWLILIEVVIEVLWQILVKDILGWYSTVRLIV